MITFTEISSRCSWRIIEADGYAQQLTREGAARYLIRGRNLGRRWVRTKNGWYLLGDSK